MSTSSTHDGQRNEHWRAFDPDWFDRHQRTILWLLNAPLLKHWARWAMRIRYYDCPINKPITKIRPHFYERPGENEGEIVADFRTHWKFAKRVYYAFRPVWWAMHWWDETVADRCAPWFSFGFSVLTTYPDAHPETTTVDGDCNSFAVGGTWASVRDGTGIGVTDSNSIANIAITSDGTGWSSVARSFFLFDLTSSKFGVISAAVLYLYGSTKTDTLSILPSYGIVTSNPSSNTSLVATDFSTLGSTLLASTVSYSNFSLSNYNEFVLSVGLLTLVNTILKLGARESTYDLANIEPSFTANNASRIYVFTADETGTSKDPKLIVSFSQLGNSVVLNLRPSIFSPGNAR